MSVVRTKQPTLSFVASDPGRDDERRAGDDGRGKQQRAPRPLEREGDERCEQRAAAAPAGRSRGSRDRPPLRARARARAPFRSATTSARSATTAMTSPSSTSRFRCMSCQTRNGCSVAIVAPTTPTRSETTRRPISSTIDRGQSRDRDVRDARRRASAARRPGRARRGTRRTGAACSRKAARAGTRTSRSRPASARSGRSSRRAPRGSCPARRRRTASRGTTAATSTIAIARPSCHRAAAARGAGVTAASSHARCQSSRTSRHQSRWP